MTKQKQNDLRKPQIQLLKTEKSAIAFASVLATLQASAKAADAELGTTTASSIFPQLAEKYVEFVGLLEAAHSTIEFEALNAQSILLASGGTDKGCKENCATILGIG